MVELTELKIKDFTIKSALAHKIVFEDGDVLLPNPELAKVISATAVEEKVDEFRVKTTFKPNPKAVEFLKQQPNNILFLTSIIGLNCYPSKLISPITTPETTRLPPEQKLCYKNKFNCL